MASESYIVWDPRRGELRSCPLARAGGGRERARLGHAARPDLHGARKGLMMIFEEVFIDLNKSIDYVFFIIIL